MLKSIKEKHKIAQVGVTRHLRLVVDNPPKYAHIIAADVTIAATLGSSRVTSLWGSRRCNARGSHDPQWRKMTSRS